MNEHEILAKVQKKASKCWLFIHQLAIKLNQL